MSDIRIAVCVWHSCCSLCLTFVLQFVSDIPVAVCVWHSCYRLCLTFVLQFVSDICIAVCVWHSYCSLCLTFVLQFVSDIRIAVCVWHSSDIRIAVCVRHSYCRLFLTFVLQFVSDIPIAVCVWHSYCSLHVRKHVSWRTFRAGISREPIWRVMENRLWRNEKSQNRWAKNLIFLYIQIVDTKMVSWITCLVMGVCTRGDYTFTLRLSVHYKSGSCDILITFLAHLRTMSSKWAFVVAHCPSVCVCVCSSVNNFFKQLFLNHLAKFVKTLWECSLHKSLSKLFRELNSMKNWLQP